jgi:methionine sulfoxide reductase catalytic subunit
MLIKIPKGWEIPEREVTPETVYLDRRKFLTRLSTAALGGVGGVLLPSAAGVAKDHSRSTGTEAASLQAPRNPEFKVDRPITSERVATGYNNYYEFTDVKERVWKLAQRFESRPWHVEIKGLVETPQKLDVDDLIKQMTLEERVYRHRCVEAWSMVIPWVGFPLRKLVEWCAPKPKAHFLRMVSFLRPGEAEGQRQTGSAPWPYHEALTLEEATNDLAMVVLGMYGKTLPNQNGAPIRLITPWKYGYKGIKGITRFEFVEKRPSTFWNTAVPSEYDFWGNALPWKPHPRWSQETERVVETGQRIPSLPYNGYEKYVAQLYKG